LPTYPGSVYYLHQYAFRIKFFKIRVSYKTFFYKCNILLFSPFPLINFPLFMEKLIRKFIHFAIKTEQVPAILPVRFNPP